MPSSSCKREHTSVNISLVISVAVFCLVLIMLFLARSGKADAGFGQPVTLGPPQFVSTGSGPSSISFFSTGFHDAVLAITNNGNDTVSVVQQDFLGGSFQPATNYSLPAGAQPQSVAVATRFTGTFVLQNFIAVADTGINKVSVLLKTQSTADTYNPPVNYDVGTAPRDVAIGRIVGDDNFDIVTANFGSNNVTVLTGKSDGTFGNAVSITVNTQPTAVALGTIDNNASTDIVTCSSTGLITVLRANSGGTFTAFTYVGTIGARDIALDDFDQDGDLDVVTANGGSNNVSVLINDGSGGFSFADSYPAGLNPRSVAIGDLNLDGKPDLAVASAGNGLNLLLNNGDGTFGPPVNFSMGQSPFGVAVGSFQPGKIDVATANNGDGTVAIRLNTTVPLLSFASPSPAPANPQPYSVAAFNRFGKPGVAVTNNDPVKSFVSVLYKPIPVPPFNSVFGAPTNYALLPGSQPEQVVAGNLGQISIPSLVVALPNANKVAILLGNSDDSFQPPFYKDVGTFPRSVALADFNSDGNLDIAAANFASFTVSMLFGNADRTFQDAFTIAGVLSANPEFIVAGDFNNDGKADIATCNSGPPDHNKVNVLLGNGNGSFQPLQVYTVGLNPRFMTTGDFNQDGNLDLAVSDTGQNKVSVLLNNGSGVFQPASHYPVGLHPNYIATGDFNLDGETDLAVSNGDSRTFSVLLNNGEGTFKDALSFPVGLGPIGITVGDFDFDNKPDVVTANHGDGTISLVLNTLTPLIPAPPNDNFANAEVLDGFSGRTVGTNVGATTETNEPTISIAGSASVWYRWTAPADGGVTIDTFESSIDTLLAVYTGNNLATLTTIASNNNDLSPAGDARVTSKVKFNAVSGTTYKIAVAGFGVLARGNLSLNWTLLPPPANDDFANAQTISGASGVVAGTNAGATKEQGEPNHADNPGGASLWYRWTAPSDGPFTFNTSSSKISCNTNANGCSYDTLLAVYRGASLQEISQPQNLVAKNDDEPQRVTSLVSFPATAGTTYQIAVDSKGNPKSDIVLSWFAGVSSHDSFATALQITGSSGSSSSQPGSNGETWFRWVAPESGTVTFFAKEFVNPIQPTFEFPSTLSVFSVSGQSTSSLIGKNTGPCTTEFANRFCDSSHVTFSAVAQAEYAIQIFNPLGTIGLASLSWSFGAAPPTTLTNDTFAAARIITGFGNGPSPISFNNSTATKEAGEPNHGGNPGGHSLWFDWTAPGTFQVSFSTAPQNFQNIFIAAYTGTTVSTLSSVAEGSPSITFGAVKDTTYHIAVDSQSTGSGLLSWTPTNAPPNDLFVNAQLLDGSSGKVLGTNINATPENGEPFHIGFSAGSSIWYSWTAPSNGFFTFDTNGSDTNTVLALYSGSVLGSLSPVVSNDNESSTFPIVTTSRVTFFALAGQNYKIAVSGSTGTIRLQWGATRKIGGRITNIRGVGIASITVSLTGHETRTRVTDSQGFYNFSDVPEGGTYVVTPSTASYTYDVASRTYSPTADITDANFVALTPVYSIQGRITAGGVGVANITVKVTGTINTSVLTNAQGAYSFPTLTTNGDYTITASSPLFTFSAFSILKDRYFFPSLNDNYAGVDFTATAVPNPPPQILLEDPADTPNQVAAVDAILMVRDPFPVVNSANLLIGPDLNTRVLIFVSNLQLAAGETPAVIVVHLVDSNMQPFDVAAENFSTLAGFDFSQLTFRLPNGLAPGTCTIEVRAHGQVSNTGTIRIRP